MERRGCCVRLGKDARHFQQDAAAGGVVVGAVVDVVARHFGTNAEVVVVRGVHDGFVFELGVGARQHGDHVVAIRTGALC